MTKQQLPAISTLTSSTLEDFKTADKVVVVAFIAADDKTSNTTYTSLAESLRDDYVFGAVADASVAKAEGVKVPGLVVYKSFDEGKAVFDGKFTTEAVTNFVQAASTPLVGEVGPETYQTYMSAGIPLAYIFAETAEERESLAKTLKPVAEKYKGKINFATIDANAFGAHAGNLNLPAEEWPAFAIQDTVTDEKYPFDGNKLTEKKIAAFVKDYTDGKIKPSIKSEPVPEKNDGPVTVLVATTFKELVLDNTNADVLVEFYAPWCGHCKALAPTYEKLGELYTGADAKKVIIAKIDATANDVPEKIQGFPTIKLYTAKDKANPIDYSGSRTLEDLAKFIAEKGSHKVDGLSGRDAMEIDDEDELMDGLPVKAAPAATKAASDASSAASSAGSAASSKATDTASQVKKSASSAVSSGASKASDSVSSAASSVSSNASAAASDASSAAASAASSASQLSEQAKSSASVATESAKGAAHKIVDAVKGAASIVEAFAGDEGGTHDTDARDEL